jgi:hypothetical protein
MVRTHGPWSAQRELPKAMNRSVWIGVAELHACVARSSGGGGHEVVWRRPGHQLTTGLHGSIGLGLVEGSDFNVVHAPRHGSGLSPPRGGETGEWRGVARPGGQADREGSRGARSGGGPAKAILVPPFALRQIYDPSNPSASLRRPAQPAAFQSRAR